MICIFGLHDFDYKEIIDYYDINNKISEDYYYPIVFFSWIKDVLFDYIRMIGDSTCLNTALEEYKKIINEDAKKPAQLDIKKDLEYLMRNTVFIPFFSKDDWGVTIPAFNLSFINLDIYDLQENNNSYPDYVFLFYFIKYVISFLREPVGHNFKIFESYNEKLETPFDTPKRTKDGRITQNEGGYLMEMLLINSVEYLNIEHVLF